MAAAEYSYTLWRERCPDVSKDPSGHDDARRGVWARTVTRIGPRGLAYDLYGYNGFFMLIGSVRAHSNTTVLVAAKRRRCS